MSYVTALPFLKLMIEVFTHEGPIEPGTLMPSEDVKQLMANPQVERSKVLEMGAAIKEIKEAGEQGLAKIDVRVVDRFGRALTVDEMNDWLEKHQR